MAASARLLKNLFIEDLEFCLGEPCLDPFSLPDRGVMNGFAVRVRHLFMTLAARGQIIGRPGNHAGMRILGRLAFVVPLM